MVLLRTKLVIFFVLLGLVPLTATLVLTYYLGYDVLLTRTKNQLQSEAYQRGYALEQINELRIQQLSSLAVENDVQDFVKMNNAIPDGNKFDKNVLQSYREKLEIEINKFHVQTGGETGFDNIVLLDKSGKVLFATKASQIGKDLSTNKQFAIGLNQKLRYLTLENGTVRAEVVVPVIDSPSSDNSIIGILTASTSPYFMDEILLNREGLGNTGESYIVNSDMMLVSPSRFIDGVFKQKVDTNPVRECFEDGQNSITSQYSGFSSSKNSQIIMGKGGFAYSDYRNIPVFGASFCDKKLGYVLLAEIDQQEVLAPLLQLEIDYLLVGIIISTLIFIFATVVTKQIVKPINKLKMATKKIIDGNLESSITLQKNDEIGDLAAVFEKMREKLQFTISNLDNLIMMRTNQLHETTKEMAENQIILSNTLKEITKIKKALDESSLVAITDKDGNITYANQRFCEVSKYSLGELIGKNHRILKSDYHPPEFYQGMWNIISRGRIWRGEIKNKAKDGTFYWVKTIVMPIIGHDGRPVEYVSVRTEITHEKETADKLEDALVKLQGIDKQKDEFLSMISHELRTPLIPILGYCEMILDHGMTNISDTQRQVISDIQKNGKRIRKMIDDILLVQKLEMGQIKFEKQLIELMPFMKSLLRSYLPVTSQKHIEIVDSTSEEQTFKSDPDKLTEVFANLIENAIDFTSSGGRIEIGAKSNDNQMVFYVKDNGAGIPKNKQGDLFKRFYQVDTSSKRQHQGTGLGLSICKDIIEGLGGKIWVESEEGKGATFYFKIPGE